MNKAGRAFTSVTFFPKYQPKYRDDNLERKELQKQVPVSWTLTKNVLDYLKTAFDFENKEITQHLDLFKCAENRIDDFIGFMSKLKARANRAKNPKGYLINSIKKELGAQMIRF